jgi:hypothetical protein
MNSVNHFMDKSPAFSELVELKAPVLLPSRHSLSPSGVLGESIHSSRLNSLGRST